jgi:putative tricarboxylic transport membrane protein
MQEDQQQHGKAVGSMRTWEIVVAALFLVFGAVVVWDSQRLGAAWSSDGPQAGYFPFYIGLIICISSIANLIGAFSKAANGSRPFVHRGQLRMVLTVMIPSIVYVALIANPVYSLGIYEASAIFIALFMRYLGKYAWPKTAAVSIGVVVVFFIMFEVWFKVPLPKGPIEALLGFQ